MYKMREEREMKVKTLSSLVSSMLFERRYAFCLNMKRQLRSIRFGPWFIQPVVAGLTEENKPFLSSMDCLGCEMFTDDFVVAGTMEEALYGMCESMYRPNLVNLSDVVLLF